ncbi:hypothetical protein ACFODQ_03755 [Comamonas sp. JC664]
MFHGVEVLAALVSAALFVYLVTRCCGPKNSEKRERAMYMLQDLVFVGLTLACFVGLLGFVRALVRI